MKNMKVTVEWETEDAYSMTLTKHRLVLLPEPGKDMISITQNHRPQDLSKGWIGTGDSQLYDFAVIADVGGERAEMTTWRTPKTKSPARGDPDEGVK